MEAALIDQLLASIDVSHPESVADGMEHLCDELERYINASQMAGFAGLALICEHVNANIELLREDLARFTADRLGLLQTWIHNVKAYLSDFSENDAGLQLLAQLGAEDWPLPVSLEFAASILAQLHATGANVTGQQTEIRKQIAGPDDISLDLPEDVNAELLDILVHELPVQTREFSAAIQKLQAGGGLADLEIAQRVAHTVKGAANTVGIKGIAELTHYLEDILVACAQATKLPGNELLNVLIDAADCLEGMSETITELTPPPGEALAVLQAVLDWANRIDQVGIQEIDAQASNEAIDTGTADTAQQPPSEASPDKRQSAMVRVATEQMESLFRLAGENIILGSQANERLRRMKNQLQAMETQLELLRQLGDELERLIDLKDLSGRALTNEAGVDALEMDQYNELHTASRRMVEAAFDVREMTLDAGKELAAMNQLLEDQQRLVNETQETIMKRFAANLPPDR
jgi:chemosensory pili system protein ChpA (sensor histidine kinase/response regulator)